MRHVLVRSPVPRAVKRRLLYALERGRLPRLHNPRTFTDKVNWRILNDRRSILAFTCDKLRVKEEGAQLGIEVPGTLWSGTDVREAVGVQLPDNWVLKPNHRTHLVHFGHGTMPDTSALVSLTEGWLYDYQGRQLGEWAYTQARPMLLIEEMLGDGRHVPLTSSCLRSTGS